VLAAAPLAGLAAIEAGSGRAADHHAGMDHAAKPSHDALMGGGEAGPGARRRPPGTMRGAGPPAPGGPRALDALLYPPPALPHEPGRVREYTLVAADKEIEVAPGVRFAACTYNGTDPGPVIRATEDDLLRVRFVNGSSHPHTIHFHGIHP